MDKRNIGKRISLKLKKPAAEKSLPELEVLYEQLKERHSNLDKEIQELVAQGVDTNLQPQMKALHDYNEMKDMTQMVLGYLADISQTSVADLHKLFNLPLD